MATSETTTSRFDTNHIIGTYGLTMNHQCDLLDELLNVSGIIPPEDQPWLEKYRLRMEQQGSFWNEEELKMRFLAFLFDYAEITEKGKIEIFFERTLSAVLLGKKQSVKCDCLLARPFGIYEPQVPYFFLQEFKKQKQQEDTEGQVLMAMLIAQKLNGDAQPLYGCYLQGRYWVFCVLHDNRYCVSRTYETTRNEDLYQVIFVLRKLKQIILTRKEV